MSDSNWSVVLDEKLAAEREKVRVLRDAILGVLCNAEGIPCFGGPDGGDRAVIADALAATEPKP
jgi:hypothetical protein